MTNNIKYRLVRCPLRPAILTANTDSAASMRSDTTESRFLLFHSHPNHVDTFNSFDFFNLDIFDFCRLLPKVQRLTISLVWRASCPYRTCKNVPQERGGRYVTGFHIPPQVEQVVPRSTVSPGIRTVGFRALWPVAGARLTGRCCHE
jgi:hypothetical protein